MRRRGDLGIGDTTALREWIDWAAETGVAFIQLLPINENGIDESPYSAISSTALDPIYLTLDISEIPWLSDTDFARADAIRQDLLAQGIVLKDSALGTTWEAAS